MSVSYDFFFFFGIQNKSGSPEKSKINWNRSEHKINMSSENLARIGICSLSFQCCCWLGIDNIFPSLASACTVHTTYTKQATANQIRVNALAHTRSPTWKFACLSIQSIEASKWKIPRTRKNTHNRIANTRSRRITNRKPLLIECNVSMPVSPNENICTVYAAKSLARSLRFILHWETLQGLVGEANGFVWVILKAITIENIRIDLLDTACMASILWHEGQSGQLS